MILYTNGCSFTSGYGTDDSPENSDYGYVHNHAWPQQLGELLGASEVYNESYAGGSNDRILRTATNWILRNRSFLSRTNEKLVVVIGWTDFSRREFFVGGQWKQIIPYHRYPKDRALDKLNVAYMKTAWDDKETTQRFALQLATFCALLEREGINYFFFDAFTPVHDILALDTEFWKPYLNYIDQSRYLRFGEPGGDMRSFLESSFPEWRNRHPSKEGHKAWAMELKTWINDKISER